MSEDQRCNYVKEDGTCCGQECNELAEWWVNNQAEDDSDYEEFLACSTHLADMLSPGVGYLVQSIEMGRK